MNAVVSPALPARPRARLAWVAGALLLLALGWPPGAEGSWFAVARPALAWLLIGGSIVVAARLAATAAGAIGSAVAALVAGFALASLPAASGDAAPTAGFALAGAATLLVAALSVQRLAALDSPRWSGAATALVFGLWVLCFWQIGVTAYGVPRVLLPAPAAIARTLAESAPLLARDFVQTVLKAVLLGWALGSALGFAVGVAIDRLPFLQRGLLPVASLSSTVPLVAVAPIMVMWFGFEWPSKAAVVVLMTFFPMLVATLAGLGAAGRLELELMHSYAAGYLRTLAGLRLPCAVPHIVGALKVNATLALIGAIVAEFFGSPTVGLGFRIATEAAKMNMALVWAAIVVAAATGSLAYALLVRLERKLAFWHPSVRAR